MSMMNPFPNLQFLPDEDDPTGEFNRAILERSRRQTTSAPVVTPTSTVVPRTTPTEPEPEESEAARALREMAEQMRAQQAELMRQMEAQRLENAAATQRQQANAIENLSRMFNEYGLGTLAPTITKFVQDGYSADTIALMLADTPEYKQRFSANEARRKAGLRVLSPGEYLAAEKSYRDILRANGLPSGFYDQQDDFTKFIAADVSPAEMNQRVAAASVFLENADPVFKTALSSLYNMDAGDMLAYVLDPQRALPIINKRVAAVRVGGAAMREGFNVNQAGVENLLQNDDLYTSSDAQLRQQAREARLISDNQQKLASIEGDLFTDSDALDITFGENTNKMMASQQRAMRERSRFAGESGINSRSLRTNSGL